MKSMWKVALLAIVGWIVLAAFRSIFKVSDWYQYPFFFVWAAILASIIVFIGLFMKIIVSWSYTKLLVGWSIAYLVLILVWWIDKFVWG
jgi:hypothetical protein